MGYVIDNKYETKFRDASKVFIQNVEYVRKGDDYMPAEAFSGSSAGPTLLSGQQDNPKPGNQNDLVNSAAALDQADKKRVASS